MVSAETQPSRRQAQGGKAAGRQKGKAPSSGMSLAWTTDEDSVEQQRGVTIDIATRIFRSRDSAKTFSLVDSPGHRDYVPAMILGACQANAAILVVDGSTGEFESGFSEEGQTREHAVLLRSLGVGRVVVVVNKMDTVEFSKERFDAVCQLLSPFLKSLGWRAGKDLFYIPASGLSGVNLVDAPSTECPPLHAWYKGETVLGALEALPTATANEVQLAANGKTRLVVSDSFRSSSLGGVIAMSGRLVSGVISAKDQLRLSPTTEIATVKGLEVGTASRSGKDAYAVAGADNLPVTLGLINVSPNVVVSPGDVLCDPQSPVPVVTRFRGQVVTIAAPLPLVEGLQVELHLGGRCEAATISKLVEAKSATSKTAGAAKKRPRRLAKGDAAVIEVTVLRPICVELAKDVKFLGRFALRCQGKTIVAGMVTELLKDKKPKSSLSIGCDAAVAS